MRIAVAGPKLQRRSERFSDCQAEQGASRPRLGAEPGCGHRHRLEAPYVGRLFVGLDGAGTDPSHHPDRLLWVCTELDEKPGRNRTRPAEAAATVHQQPAAGAQKIAEHGAVYPPRLLERGVGYRDVDDRQVDPGRTQRFHRRSETRHHKLLQLVVVHQGDDHRCAPGPDRREIGLEAAVPGTGQGGAILLARAQGQAEGAAARRRYGGDQERMTEAGAAPGQRRSCHHWLTFRSLSRSIAYPSIGDFIHHRGYAASHLIPQIRP